TVDPAFAGGDSIPGMTDERLGDTGEVVEHLALRRPRVRVEDLIEIGKRQPMACDGDLLLWHGHLLCPARLLAFPAAHEGWSQVHGLVVVFRAHTPTLSYAGFRTERVRLS